MGKNKAIAIDCGGTFVKIGLVNDTEVFKETKIPANRNNFTELLNAIKTTINNLLKETKTYSSELSGIGFAFPGIVDSINMKVLSTNEKYDDAKSIDFKKWAQESWELPIIIDNDARMATVGEWKYGAGVGLENMVMMTLGTGIGTSVILENKVLTGKHFQAGCLGGHMTVQVNGKTCGCGNKGCVEAESSSWQLPELVKSDSEFSSSQLKDAKIIDFELLFNLALEGDKLAIKLRNYCMDIWSSGLINLIHAYDPEIAVIGGGIMQSKEVIIPYLQDKINQYAWTPWGNLEVKSAHLDNSAALMGVAYMVFNKL